MPLLGVAEPAPLSTGRGKALCERIADSASSCENLALQTPITTAVAKDGPARDLECSLVLCLVWAPCAAIATVAELQKK